MVITLLGLLVQACDDGKGGDSERPLEEPSPEALACEQLEPRPFWANAFLIVDGIEAAGGWARSSGLTGEVAEITKPSEIGQGLGSGRRSDAYALRVETPSQSLEVALALPWRAPIAKVGDTISVNYAIEVFASNPNSWEYGSIEIRDEAGELLAWLHAGGSEDLRPPREIELELTPGCTYDQGSGPIIRRGLHVDTGAASADLTVGETADVGDFVVLHGDNTDDRGAKLTNCADCFTSHRVAIAIVRGSQASLAMPAPDEDAGF